MKYLLLIYGNEAAMEAASASTPPDQQAAEAKVWYEYGDWLKEKGWYLAGEALQATSTATSVRAPDGEPIVTDGPFAETKEQLGGYYVLDVANVDDAIERKPLSRRDVRHDRAATNPGLPGSAARLR